MKKLYKGFLALITVGFLSAPTIAAPVELHYWHGHTGKLEAIINEIADRWNASQDESMLIPTSKGSYEDILAAFIAAYRAGEHPHMVQVYDAGAAIMVAQVKNGVVYPFEDMAAKYGVDPHDYEAALFHGYPSLSSFLFSFVPFAELIRFKHSWKFETIKHALQGQLTY